jgi:hypothetical protein
MGGTTYRLLDYSVIYVCVSISLSEVKEIVKEIRMQFQNGNEADSVGALAM